MRLVRKGGAVTSLDSIILPRISTVEACEEKFEYSQSKRYVVRIVHLPNGHEERTRIMLRGAHELSGDPQLDFDYAFLRWGKFTRSYARQAIRGGDLFSGCGGLTLGAVEACRALGKQFLPVMAVDKETEAMKVYVENFHPSNAFAQDITEILDGKIGSKLTEIEQAFLKEVGELEILLAGPPCQGHSSLNNYSRHKDKRNILYERVARFVELAQPKHVLIENVPEVLNSKERVVQKTIDIMRKIGYNVDSGIVDLASLGVPQRRKRHVIVASTSKSLSVRGITERHRIRNHRSVKWAIGDIEGESVNSIFTAPTRHSEDNLRRIEYLHQEQVYDLPNELRPKCHKNGGHAYKSMYGRMKYDEPSQTITTGFPSPGQGRFVHPTRLRTIRPHEAARLQFFPDTFVGFSQVETRESLSKMIGNAAPMKLSYIFCLELLA